MKKPWLAATLNLLPLPVPLGYVYLGKWKRAVGVFFVRCGVLVVGFGISMLASLLVCDFDIAESCIIRNRGIELLLLGISWGLFLVPVGIVILFNSRDAFRLGGGNRGRGRRKRGTGG